jgi:uncharacterized SAM-binding protein YcdF (DUF218 family)
MILQVLIGYILGSELILWRISRPKAPPESPRYLILLGHKGGEQSPVTKDRFFNAVEAMKRWPKAQLIITGNEEKGEVSHYRGMLAKVGITDYLIEAKSKTTWGNLKNILPLLESQDQAVVIITSEYHQRRSLFIARAYRLNAHAFGKDQQKYGPRLWVKERLALWYSLPKAAWIYLTSKR